MEVRDLTVAIRRDVQCDPGALWAHQLRLRQVNVEATAAVVSRRRHGGLVVTSGPRALSPRNPGDDVDPICVQLSCAPPLARAGESGLAQGRSRATGSVGAVAPKEGPAPSSAQE